MSKKIDIGPIKRTIADWGKVVVLLLDEAAVILVVILALRFFRLEIPLPVTIVLGLVLGTLVVVIHVAVIPSFHKRVVTGPEGMLGTQGRVVDPLNPVGAIVVSGERWRAMSVDESIGVDEDVEIVGLAGLTLKVKRKERWSTRETAGT